MTTSSNPGPATTLTQNTSGGYGNIAIDALLGLTISPASVAANTTVEQTFTITGVQVGDVITVSKPTAQAGLGVVGSRSTAANTIGITFANATASPIVPTAAETYVVNVVRPMSQYIGALPTALPL